MAQHSVHCRIGSLENDVERIARPDLSSLPYRQLRKLNAPKISNKKLIGNAA